MEGAAVVLEGGIIRGREKGKNNENRWFMRRYIESDDFEQNKVKCNKIKWIEIG